MDILCPMDGHTYFLCVFRDREMSTATQEGVGPSYLKFLSREYRIQPFESNKLTDELYNAARNWEKQVNTLTNERDLARRANEQNIKIIKNLRKQLRKDKQR